MKTLSASLLLLLALTGCSQYVQHGAEPPDTHAQGNRHDFAAWLNASIGTLTVHEAVARYGTPIRSQSLPGTLALQWGNQGQGIGQIWQPFGTRYALDGQASSGWQMDLIFAPETQRLTSWRVREW